MKILVLFSFGSAGMKTGYKATVKLVNGSTGQVRIGLGLVLFDRDGKLVGVGTTGTKLGTIDPGDEATFSIDFNHVTERLEQANQFQLVVETRSVSAAALPHRLPRPRLTECGAF